MQDRAPESCRALAIRIRPLLPRRIAGEAYATDVPAALGLVPSADRLAERDVGRTVIEMKTWVCPSGRVSSGLERGVLTIEHMTIRRMEHVGIVVDDLAVELFV